MEPTIANKTAWAGQLRSWLFNPFKYIAGFGALLLGMGVIVASAFLGWLGTTHFDGVLDFHIGFEAPAWIFFAEGFLNWVCLAMPLYFFGLIIAKSAPRFIDVFGTQALARGPYLIAALVMLPEANRRFGADLLRAAAKRWSFITEYKLCGHGDIYHCLDNRAGNAGLDGGFDVSSLCGFVQFKRR